MNCSVLLPSCPCLRVGRLRSPLDASSPSASRPNCSGVFGFKSQHRRIPSLLSRKVVRLEGWFEAMDGVRRARSATSQ